MIERHLPSVVFAFGNNNLWIDSVAGLSQAEIWPEIVTNNIESASEHIDVSNIVRCDEIGQLPDGFDAFWISSPHQLYTWCAGRIINYKQKQGISGITADTHYGGIKRCASCFDGCIFKTHERLSEMRRACDQYDLIPFFMKCNDYIQYTGFKSPVVAVLFDKSIIYV